MARGVIKAIARVEEEALRIKTELNAIKAKKIGTWEAYQNAEDEYNRAHKAHIEAEEAYKRAKRIAKVNMNKLNHKNNDLNLLLGNQSGRSDAEVVDLLRLPVLQPLTEDTEVLQQAEDAVDNVGDLLTPESSNSRSEVAGSVLDKEILSMEMQRPRPFHDDPEVVVTREIGMIDQDGIGADDSTDEAQCSADEHNQAVGTENDIPHESCSVGSMGSATATSYREASIYSNIDVARPNSADHEAIGSAIIDESSLRQSTVEQCVDDLKEESVSSTTSSPQSKPLTEDWKEQRRYETDSESDGESLFIKERVKPGKKNRHKRPLRVSQNDPSERNNDRSELAEVECDDLFGEPIIQMKETSEADVEATRGTQSTSTSPRESRSGGYKQPSRKAISLADRLVADALLGSLRKSTSLDSMYSLFNDEPRTSSARSPRAVEVTERAPYPQIFQQYGAATRDGREQFVDVDPRQQRPQVGGGDPAVQGFSLPPQPQQPTLGWREAQTSTGRRKKRRGSDSEQEAQERKQRVLDPEGDSKTTRLRL